MESSINPAQQARNKGDAEAAGFCSVQLAGAGRMRFCAMGLGAAVSLLSLAQLLSLRCSLCFPPTQAGYRGSCSALYIYLEA